MWLSKVYNKTFFISNKFSFFKYYDYICATNKKFRPYNRSVKKHKNITRHMKGTIQKWKFMILLGALLFLSNIDLC